MRNNIRLPVYFLENVNINHAENMDIRNEPEKNIMK